MRYVALMFVMVALAVGVLEAAGWTGFVSSNDVSSIWADSDFVYWGSSGGVVIRDRATSAEEKLLKEPGGLASNRIGVVVRDEDGRLWIGTKDSGVCVLTADATWQFHNTGNLHLLSNEVTDIATFGGRTVVATTGGISLFEAGEFRTWYDGSRWATSGCSPVGGVALSGYEMLVGADCGLFSYQFDSRTWKAVVTDPGGYRIAYDGTDMFWVIDTEHMIIYAYDGLSVEVVPKTLIMNDGLRDIAALESIVWIVTDLGPSRFNHRDRLWQRYRSNIEDITRQVYSIHLAADSSLWIGTDVAAASLVDSAWVLITSQGPPGNYVEDLEVDAAGDIWCATGTRGGEAT
jgi:ligand-binding sensor domain-containing protein